MGCSSSDLGVIKEDEINPPVISTIPNLREKTELFPEGEIYYLRNIETIKKGANNPNKNFLAYDELTIEFSLCYKFKYETLINKFIDSTIKFYHSDIQVDSQYTFVGSTERFKNKNGDCFFIKKFQMQYCFQKEQHIKLEIELNHNIQVVNTTLGEIIGSKEKYVELPFFYNGKVDDTSVIIKGVVLKDVFKNSFVTFNLKTEFPLLPFSDYFVVIYNWNDKHSPTKVWKSNEMTGKSFDFVASMVTLQDLCLGNPKQKITFEFYGIYSGKVGTVDTTLKQLKKAMKNKEKIQILDDENNNNVSGTFMVEYTIEKISRFIDLIENGLQISLTVAIDYTASNKEPTSPESLHFIYPDANTGKKELNQYETTINYCGGIVSKYDFYKYFPVLGFGGILPATGETSHCFNVTLTGIAKVQGLDNVFKVYHESLSKVKFDGPTYFAPLIKNSIQLIKENESTTSIYHVILIITDGVIHDFDETKSTIIKTSYLPYSIVVVGVGNDNFSSMEQLSSDKHELIDKNGNKAERDIIQFVRFLDYEDDPVGLAEEILMKIPSQIEKYYRIYKKFIGLRNQDEGDDQQQVIDDNDDEEEEEEDDDESENEEERDESEEEENKEDEEVYESENEEKEEGGDTQRLLNKKKGTKGKKNEDKKNKTEKEQKDKKQNKETKNKDKNKKK